MKKSEAKALSLEVWGWLKDHPEIGQKSKLPAFLLSKIQYTRCYCPLCELFSDGECAKDGEVCILYPCCDSEEDAYSKWVCASTNAERKAAAEAIYQKIEAWDTGEE